MSNWISKYKSASQERSKRLRFFIENCNSIAEVQRKYNLPPTTARRAFEKGYYCPGYREKQVVPLEGKVLLYWAEIERIAHKTWQKVVAIKIADDFLQEDFVDLCKDTLLQTKCAHNNVLGWAKTTCFYVALNFIKHRRNIHELTDRERELEDTPFYPDDSNYPVIEHPHVLLQEIQENLSEGDWQTLWKWANNRRAYRTTPKVRKILALLVLLIEEGRVS